MAAESAEQEGKALLERAHALRQQSRPEEALSLYDEVVQRFGTEDDDSLIPLVGQAIVDKAHALAELERLEDAVSVCEAVIQGLGASSEPPVRVQVARAMTCKADSLVRLNQFEAALTAAEAIARHFKDAQELPIHDSIAQGLQLAGVALLREAKRLWPKQRDLALKHLARARNKLSASLARRPRHASALWHAGYIVFLQGKRDEARAFLAEALQLGGEEQRAQGLQGCESSPLPEDEELRALVGSL